MDGFEKRRNDKKEAIIQAALELFNQYGFDKVSVSEIASKAHVSKVSIYNFFESKDNLRRIIVQSLLDESLEKTQSILASDKNFIEKINEFLKNRVASIGNINLQFIFDAIESDLVIRKYFEDFNNVNKQMIRDLINEGKLSNYLSKEISGIAIEIYIDIFYQYNLHFGSEIQRRSEFTPHLIEEINSMFLNGMINKE